MGVVVAIELGGVEGFEIAGEVIEELDEVRGRLVGQFGG